MPRAEGVFQTKSGRWAARIGDRYLGTFPTQGQAIAARDRAREAGRTGKAIPDARTTKLTVAYFAEAYLTAKVGTHRTLTLERDAWTALSPTFADRPVYALRKADVEEWLAKQKAHPYAPSTIGQRLGVLRRILDRAADELQLPNPARLIRASGTTGRLRPYGLGAKDTTKVAKVLAAATPRFRIAVILAGTLGLRSGEVRGLTEDRVNFATGEITVDRQLQERPRGSTWEPGSVHVTETLRLIPVKSRKHGTKVYADRAVLALLRAHIEEYGTGPEGLIVTNRHGGAMGPGSWTFLYKELRKRTGITLTGHDLRHYVGSYTYAETKDHVKAAAALRHSVQVAINTYLHGDEEADGSISGAILAGMTPEPRASRADRHLRAV